MRSEYILSSVLLYVASHAAPIDFLFLQRREVPQERSHNVFLASVRSSLTKDNPDNIQDPVFGLLGNAAAAAGQGSITDTDCLHQATADQAFTNAKAAGDVNGMTDALIYAALERNTGKVGLASVKCTAIKATNPEIAAISQHQVCSILTSVSRSGYGANSFMTAGPSFARCSGNQQGRYPCVG